MGILSQRSSAREVDGGASSPATATPCGKRIRFPAEIVLIGSSRGLRPSRAHPEAEGTDSPPHHPFSDSAEILRISGRGICKEAIFSPGGQAPRSEKISTRGDQPKSSISLGRSQSDLLAQRASNLSDAQVVGLDWKSRRFTPSRALPGLVWRGVWFPTMQGCSFDGIRFRRCGNCSLEVFRSRRRERGALRSPAPPRATGARGL